jgi:hypothetical protein
MTDATGAIYATYRVVAYTNDDESRAGCMDVQLVRDYSDFASIPAIVAASIGVAPSEVTIVSATLREG